MNPDTSHALRYAAVALLAFACTVTSEGVSAGPTGPNPAPVYTAADGRVLGVERASPEQPATYVAIVFQADGKEPIRIELAPGWYLEERGLHFTPQDRVHVEGKTEARPGGSVLVVRRIEKDGKVLELRDESGRPAWEH